MPLLRDVEYFNIDFIYIKLRILQRSFFSFEDSKILNCMDLSWVFFHQKCNNLYFYVKSTKFYRICIIYNAVGFTNVQTLHHDCDKTHHMRIAMCFFGSFSNNSWASYYSTVCSSALISDRIGACVSSVLIQIYFYEIE